MPEKFRIGIIHRYKLSLADNSNNNIEFSNFTLGADNISFGQIFDSAFSTPSRYIQEIFRRLSALDSCAQYSAKLIFNPLFEASRLAIAQILASIGEQVSFQGISVLIDQDGLPAAYLFPSWLRVDDSHFLTLLSSVNGEIDAKLCRRLFCCDAQCIPVARLYLRREQHHGFVFEANRDIYRWTAEHALSVLEPLEDSPAEKAIFLRNAIPFTAIMPQHAGDVLFFCLAWKVGGTHISQLAINKAYYDIASDIAPSLSLIPIKQPPANRDDEFRLGKVTTEQNYFKSFVAGLPKDCFYYYCRPSRDYNLSRHHLIDHFAFALGWQFCSPQNLVSRRRQPTPFRPDILSSSKRVLLHFDAGWPLKVYPKEAQEALICSLQDHGYQITVLAGDTYDHPKCEVAVFKSYAQLTELVKSHHILVGMDSFPIHYAAHVHGLPSICLFASTRPENADAPAAHNYLALEKGLRCRPCYGIVRCPIYGGLICRNFVSPEIVANAVYRMSETAYTILNVQGGESEFVPEQFCQPGPNDVRNYKMVRISLKHIQLKAAFAWTISPYLRYLARLYREFAAAVRIEGMSGAVLRTVRFIRKLMLGRS